MGAVSCSRDSRRAEQGRQIRAMNTESIEGTLSGGIVLHRGVHCQPQYILSICLCTLCVGNDVFSHLSVHVVLYMYTYAACTCTFSVSCTWKYVHAHIQSLLHVHFLYIQCIYVINM